MIYYDISIKCNCMTEREAIVVSAFTGTLFCDFDDYHKYVEEILGRPVMTHELAEEKTQNLIKEASRAEAEPIYSRLLRTEQNKLNGQE